MANVRDSDTSLWLHNKLGTSNDLWSGGSICSQLNQKVLRNIKDCFIDLQAQVKLKLLLSFLHIPRRNVDEWKTELEEIVEVAQVDSDQWVSMLAEILKAYPSTGMLNMDIEDNSTMFTDLSTELKKLVRKHSDLGMLPLECLYLNKNSLNAVVGQQPQTIKHFQLKRRPKSAALRAELLQKSSDAAVILKRNNYTPTVPIRSRGLTKKFDDTTPLKGLPARSPATAGFRSPNGPLGRLGAATPAPPGRPLGKTPLSGRKDGGIKLLDITEQPIGFGKDAKRRKRLIDMDIGPDDKIEKKDGATVATVTKPATVAAPDYAAGLVGASIPNQIVTTPSVPTPTYVPTLTNSTLLPGTAMTINAGAVATMQVRDPLQQPQPTITRTNIITAPSNNSSVVIPSFPLINSSQSLLQPPPQQQSLSVVGSNIAMTSQIQQIQMQPRPQTIQIQVLPGASMNPALQQQLLNSTVQQQQQQILNSTVAQQQQLINPTVIQQQHNPQQFQQGDVRRFQVLSAPMTGQLQQPMQQVVQQPQQTMVVQQPQQQQQQPQQPQPQKKGLSLTREQMLEAQEMFRTANKVTRPEKALILGFMAGSRENPCPNLGNVITIKLSEDQEMMAQADGSQSNYLVETLFQMNYATGEWKRLKKLRKLED